MVLKLEVTFSFDHTLAPFDPLCILSHINREVGESMAFFHLMDILH